MRSTYAVGVIALAACGTLEGPPEEPTPVAHVSVFLGDGAGTFEALPVVPVGPHGFSMLVEDLSSDGVLDILVAGYSVDAHEGDGTGGFSSTPAELRPSPRVMTVAAGDFDNDGQPDIAAAGDGSVVVFEGTVTQGFSVQSELPGAAFGRGVLAEDFDGDGNDDIATLDVAGRRIELFAGDGTGNFVRTGSLQTASAPYNMIAAQLDSDGDVDLISVSPPYTLDHEGRDAVSVFLSDGNGGFRERTDYSVAESPHHVAACDVNGDEATDVLVSSADGVVVMLGSASGVLVPHQVVPSRGSQWSLACADINSDGFADVAVTAQSQSLVIVLTGDASGSLHPSVELPAPSLPMSLEIADMNNDGLQDLVVASGPAMPSY